MTEYFKPPDRKYKWAGKCVKCGKLFPAELFYRPESEGGSGGCGISDDGACRECDK